MDNQASNATRLHGEEGNYGKMKMIVEPRRASFPKSVFAAGTAKRTTDMMQPPDRPLTTTEWRKLKESWETPQRFDIQMMGALFTSRAESLLTFVAMETGTLSYELLLRYLTLCVSAGHDAEVFEVYDIMRGSFPALDTGASSLFIKPSAGPVRWREVFHAVTTHYGDIIEAAVRHGDRATAWSLYDELLEKGAFWKKEENERLHGILLHMRNNQIYPQQGLATAIKEWFESLKGQNWTGRWTNTTTKGVCRCCGSELESIQLTAEEYQQLKDRVMADIIQGEDVFNKTTPEELERFRTFVKKKPAFDVVVDGLNVANSFSCVSVVGGGVGAGASGLTILVLGRKHMLRPSRSWDKRNMQLIQQKAHCFFTDNISEDDPFLLYATLHSGNHCRFVSRDLMRDHKACLPDGKSGRPRKMHQLTVCMSVCQQSILSYDTIIQTSGDSWHIPYDDTEDRSTYEVPQRWLCVSQKK
uniref:Mitochondrial ribonuclease P catalytic subunit n=1 Tax=Salarias fasciatus TaxID=181472 RepID=A0A672G2T0_SALFA